MPRLGLALVILLAACSPAAPDDASAQAEPRLACALGGSDWGQDCAVEWGTVGPVRLAVVRHPDGGFRRFQLARDGTGLTEADGAQPVTVRRDGALLDVTVGEDRYRIPVPGPDRATSTKSSSPSDE